MTSTTSNPVAEDNKNANVVEKNLVILLFNFFWGEDYTNASFESMVAKIGCLVNGVGGI